MKLITRYLFRDILGFFLLFIAILVTIMVIYKSYDRRDHFLENNPPAMQVAMFLVYSLPVELQQTLPVLGLLTTIFSYGLLAKNREILAMVAAGISFRRLAVPALIFGLLLTGFVFSFNEYVVPKAESKAYEIDRQYIARRQNPSVISRRRNILVKGNEDRIYFMKHYFADRQLMIFPTIIDVHPDGHNITERIEAERAILREDDPTQSNWEFVNVKRWRYDEAGRMIEYQWLPGSSAIVMEENLKQFLEREKKPIEMNYLELREYRALHAVNRDSKIYRDFSIGLHQKLSFPLACLFMALLGYAVVADVNARGFTLGVVTGLMTAVGFYLLHFLMTKLGEDSIVPPVIAGWLALAIFAATVIFYIIRLNRIRP